MNMLVGTVALVSVLWFATLVISPALAAQEQKSTEIRDSEPSETPEPAPSETAVIKAFRNALARIESDQGAYAQALPEQLLSLGLALQRQDRHEEAVDVFKRGVHLARINNGLYGAEQIPFIQGEIKSHLAIGELDEVDHRQDYLLKVQQRSLGSSEQYVQALMQQADWQYRAYRLGVGEKEFLFNRLLSMWDLYRLAVIDIGNREGNESPSMLPPLHRMLQTQYMISAYQAGSYREPEFGSHADHYRFDSYLSQNYKKGNSIIVAIYQIERARDGAHSLPVAETLVMLGDWMFWHGKRDTAYEAYLSAQAELAGLEDDQSMVDRVFGEAVALPDIDGLRPLPPAVDVDEGDILLEFKINPRGRAIEVVRLNESDSVNADRLIRRIKKTKFRPSLANGEPITTEKIVRAYEIEE